MSDSAQSCNEFIVAYGESEDRESGQRILHSWSALGLSTARSWHVSCVSATDTRGYPSASPMALAA
ncbi:hypothetical protein BH18ACT11_BH18ACT11_14060 [soil metagenome]